jgi:hypothetical protein
VVGGEAMRKYCRICWNTRYWREPTGEAARIETGKSYVQENGFGHEEWLFNFSWLQPGPNGGPEQFKYGFLQPIGKYQTAYEGKTFDVLVYAVTPAKEKVAIAIIKDVYVPHAAEIKSALGVMRKNGWVSEMNKDLADLGVPRSKFGAPTINVRFRPSDVTFFDPPIEFPKGHKLYSINRYQPVDWDDAFPESIAKLPVTSRLQKGGKPRSEAERKRVGVEGTKYSPQHVRLQNRLYKHLCDLHGKEAVGYEESWVDLSLKERDGSTYFEIKIAPTAKSCIRQALGQLLEYGIYPDQRRANKLVVVGDGKATPDDLAYLRHLRNKFGLPIYYRRWDWKAGSLGRED